jgi:hypothetical protein
MGLGTRRDDGLTHRRWQHLARTLHFREGDELLREHTEAPLEPSQNNRVVRIMVPSEAASDYKLVRVGRPLHGEDCTGKQIIRVVEVERYYSRVLTGGARAVLRDHSSHGDCDSCRGRLIHRTVLEDSR